MIDSNPYASPYTVAAQPVDVRASFIRKTYGHLAGAVLAFIAIEAAFLQIAALKPVANLMMGNWLIVLGLYMAVSWIAGKWATSSTSKNTQYLGLGLFVVAEAFIFMPILMIASTYYPGIITQAAIITVGLTGGITAIAFTTKKDFSFLDGFLKIAFLVALGVIICSFLFGFTLGIVFAAIMVALSGVAILRDTSNIIHRYGTEQYVAASLGLFASIALMFWYVIQVLMSLASND